MATHLYYILLGVYSAGLVGALFYYLTRQAPRGDAAVGWAIGIFYTAGLAGVLLAALLLRNNHATGLVVLSFPLVFLALPRVRRARTEWYTRFPAHADTPLLTLFIKNNTPALLHVRLECWFGTADSHTATLYTTFDYYLAPLEKSDFPLSARQTRLLAHKSKYVTIQIFERVYVEFEGGTYLKEIQPCKQFFNETPEVFRNGKYTVVVEGPVAG